MNVEMFQTLIQSQNWVINTKQLPLQLNKGLLSDLLLWAVLSSIINALREVLDEADALSYADLLLLCELGGQTGLTGCGMVHGHVSLLLVADEETQKTVLCSTSQSTQCGLKGQTVCVDKQERKIKKNRNTFWE